MDITDIRRANINLLADKIGRGELAEKMEYKDTVYINQLCGGHGTFGSRTARKIEKALQLNHGWMDTPQQGIEEPRKPYNTDQNTSSQSYHMAALNTLTGIVTPRSQDALNRIAKAAQEGRLEEADILLLERIAKRFEQKTT